MAVAAEAGKRLLTALQTGKSARALDLITTSPLEDLATARDSKGRCALQWCVMKGQVEAMNLLINKGFSVNSCDNTNNNALHTAAQWRKQQIYEILLSLGCSTDQLNADGRFPHEIAKEKGISLPESAGVIPHDRKENNENQSVDPTAAKQLALDIAPQKIAAQKKSSDFSDEAAVVHNEDRLFQSPPKYNTTSVVSAADSDATMVVRPFGPAATKHEKKESVYDEDMKSISQIHSRRSSIKQGQSVESVWDELKETKEELKENIEELKHTKIELASFKAENNDLRAQIQELEHALDALKAESRRPRKESMDSVFGGASYIERTVIGGGENHGTGSRRSTGQDREVAPEHVENEMSTTRRSDVSRDGDSCQDTLLLNDIDHTYDISSRSRVLSMEAYPPPKSGSPRGRITSMPVMPDESSPRMGEREIPLTLNSFTPAPKKKTVSSQSPAWWEALSEADRRRLSVDIRNAPLTPQKSKSGSSEHVGDDRMKIMRQGSSGSDRRPSLSLYKGGYLLPNDSVEPSDDTPARQSHPNLPSKAKSQTRSRRESVSSARDRKMLASMGKDIESATTPPPDELPSRLRRYSLVADSSNELTPATGVPAVKRQTSFLAQAAFGNLAKTDKGVKKGPSQASPRASEEETEEARSPNFAAKLAKSSIREMSSLKGF